MISRESIISAALDTATAHGFSGLTLQAVAQRLGVNYMSLYHHVRGIEELRDLVADAALDEVEVDNRPDRPWDETMVELSTRTWEAQQAIPGLRAYVLERWIAPHRYTPRGNSARLNEICLDCLRRAGFTPSESAVAIVALRNTTIAGRYPAGGTRGVRARARRMDAATAKAHPLLAKTLPAMNTVDGRDELEFLMRITMAGLKAELAAKRRGTARRRRKPASARAK
ncbi:MAG: TetR/AcrR family transcriptional regulator [Gammaproteobacteria bacterium]